MAPANGAHMTTSVTGLVTYALCPKRFFWSEVERLPRMTSQAVRAGTMVHRAIELHNRGQVPLEDIDWESVDPFDGQGGEFLESSWARFQKSRFAQLKPALIEESFAMRIGDLEVKGRIDAVYQEPTAWEIVDFKTGTPPVEQETSRSRLVQLQAYGLATRQGHLGREAPESVRVTFAYLGSQPGEASYEVDRTWLELAEGRLRSLAEGIAAKQWPATPSAACQSCDFVRFCPEGRAFTSG
jgi:DNA helicase-2/ATP-dependent DNA helicase PcrA